MERRNKVTNIIFIGGTGRSGTNIMKNILALHPRIAVHPFEYRFIIDPDGIIDFYKSAIHCWSPYIINNKLHRLEHFLNILSEKNKNKDIYKGWELEKHLPGYINECKKLLNQLIDFKYVGFHYGLKKEDEIYFMKYKTKSELKMILGKFIINLIDNYLDDVGKEYYVEDNTHNILFSKELLELIPDAKIIHMIRQPKDVISSLSQQRWAPKDKIQAALWYKSIIDKWNYIKNEIPKETFIEVDLYELSSNTENILKDICNFIGVEFDEKMMNLDLSKNNKNRWKKELSTYEVKEIEKILNDRKN